MTLYRHDIEKPILNISWQSTIERNRMVCKTANEVISVECNI